MNVYVASKFENKEAVRQAHAKLLDRGHTVAHDWTRCTDDREGAKEGVYGLYRADAFILLSYPDMRGAFVELGIAIADALRIVVVDRQQCDCVFNNLWQVQHAADIDDAIDLLDAPTG